MKAVRIHEYGGPEVLKYEDIEVPVQQPDEVLIRVKACALNHLDLWIRQGLPRVKSLPHILGSDISGEVVEAGSLCWRVKPGQRVLLAPGVSCRQCEWCVSGQDNQCQKYTLFGSGVAGGNREYMTAPEYTVIPIPESLGFEEAAAAPGRGRAGGPPLPGQCAAESRSIRRSFGSVRAGGGATARHA